MSFEELGRDAESGALEGSGRVGVQEIRGARLKLRVVGEQREKLS